MAERLNASVLKTEVPSRGPGVRIPPPPPCTVRYRAPPKNICNLIFIQISFMEPSPYKEPRFFYVYILISQKDHDLYIGFTSDLRKRFEEHQNGASLSTAPRRPFKIIFYEAYKNKHDALRREKYFKTRKGKTTLRSMLKEYFHTTKE